MNESSPVRCTHQSYVTTGAAIDYCTKCGAPRPVHQYPVETGNPPATVPNFRAILGKHVGPLSPEERAVVADTVRYHRPDPEKLAKLEVIAVAAEAMLVAILENAPPSADRSDAVRQIRQAKMTASAAVALGGTA